MEVLTAIDVPMFDKVNAIGGVAVVMLSYAFGEHWYLFIALLALNVLDYITGVMKSRVFKTESSSAGLRGIVKKLSYWCYVAVGFIISAVLDEMIAMTGTSFDTTPFTQCVGWFVVAMVAMNEIRSVLENLVELDAPVPVWLVNGLAVLAKKMDAAGEKIFDGSLDVDKSSEGQYRVNIEKPVEELEKQESVTLKIHMTNDEE